MDLLVEFERPVGLFHFVEVKTRLEEILGTEVDLVSRGGLKRQLRERVLAEAVDVAVRTVGGCGSKTSWIPCVGSRRTPEV